MGHFKHTEHLSCKDDDEPMLPSELPDGRKRGKGDALRALFSWLKGCKGGHL